MHPLIEAGTTAGPTAGIIAGLGATELLIILAVVVLLFGATKLPELARGSGRALRIFKAETKGLMDDDEVDPVVDPVAAPVAQPVAQPVVEPPQR